MCYYMLISSTIIYVLCVYIYIYMHTHMISTNTSDNTF